MIDDERELEPEDGDAALPLPTNASVAEVLRAGADASDRGSPTVVATVLARRGSAPSTPGQKLLVTQNAAGFSALGTIGGGAVERAVLRTAVVMLVGDIGTEGQGGARVETFKLGASLGMCCGGSVDVLLEALVVATPVLIVGAGHVGSIVAPLLARCDFAVTLVDARPECARRRDDDPPRLLRALGDFDDVGRALPRSAPVVTMTHDHQLDQRVIEWALKERFAFVGGVGSRAKHARTLARLEAKGVCQSDRDRVRMPIGMPIGARSPAEIAIAIVGELIAWRGARRTRSGL